MLKTAASDLGFQHLPRDLANVNAWKTMFDPYIIVLGCMCTNWWFCMLLFLLNRFPQVGHLQGFSPVWIIKWQLRFHFVPNLLPQKLHAKFLDWVDWTSDLPYEESGRILIYVGFTVELSLYVYYKTSPLSNLRYWNSIVPFNKYLTYSTNPLINIITHVFGYWPSRDIWMLKF